MDSLTVPYMPSDVALKIEPALGDLLPASITQILNLKWRPVVPASTRLWLLTKLVPYEVAMKVCCRAVRRCLEPNPEIKIPHVDELWQSRRWALETAEDPDAWATVRLELDKITRRPPTNLNPRDEMDVPWHITAAATAVEWLGEAIVLGTSEAMIEIMNWVVEARTAMSDGEADPYVELIEDWKFVLGVD